MRNVIVREYDKLRKAIGGTVHELANQLELEVLSQHQTRTAAGPQTVDQSYAYFEYDGRRTVTPIWISDTYPGVLIGVITLEALGLAIDPASGTLTDSEFLLLNQS